MSSEVEVAVRRELASQGRRWAPLAVAALLVVAVLGTGRDNSSIPVEAGERNDTAERADGGPAGGTDAGANADAGLDTGLGIAPIDDPGSLTPGGDPSATPGAAAVPGASAGPASQQPTAGGANQVSRTGVTCNGTNRQLPESSYGPLCAPVFKGDNGGATTFGVTADEIVVTYRIADSGSMGALQAAGGTTLESVGFDQVGIGKDMAVLVDYFNDRFELYGRKVRFVTYKGQGDILEEYQGRSQQGAQADAARAKDLGAFADVSYAGQSQLYAEAATANKTVVFSPIYLTRKWHENRAPFSHSPMWPAGEDGANFQANIVCGSLRSGKAERSNDPVMAAKDRAFGIIHPENPEYAKIGELLEARLKACGATVKRRVAYALDVTAAVQTATNAMAQMQSAGVTTVLCTCDFLVPVYLMQAAERQGFVPEWFMTFHWTDPFYRTYPVNQFRGQLVAGGVTEPYLDTEPGKVFRAASGGKQPESPYTFDKAYQQVLMLFTGLQAAGPNLTPATMYDGLQRVPDTATGAVGPLDFGPGPSMPRRWFALGVYDPNATSNLDGERGSSIACRGGKYFRFDDVAGLAGPLQCPL